MNRFILPACFSLGTAGMSTLSSRLLKANAVSLEHPPTGTGLSVSPSVVHGTIYYYTDHIYLSISDAPDLQGSSFFKDSDPESGLGGWGDPSRDIEVPTGGFSDFHLSYPSSHILRRNFTLRPYLNDNSSLFSNTQLMANTTFTKAEVRKMINGFEGDYKGMQKYLEGFGVQSLTFPEVVLALIEISFVFEGCAR